MDQLTQLASEMHRQRLADADRQRLRALHRATRGAQPQHRARLVPGHAVAVVARVLTLAGGHRLAPTRWSPGPAGASTDNRARTRDHPTVRGRTE